jgi:hypothetical protein
LLSIHPDEKGMQRYTGRHRFHLHSSFDCHQPLLSFSSNDSSTGRARRSATPQENSEALRRSKQTALGENVRLTILLFCGNTFPLFFLTGAFVFIFDLLR